jgi:hypothetical protein
VLERGQRALACKTIEGLEDYHVHLAAGGRGEQCLQLGPLSGLSALAVDEVPALPLLLLLVGLALSAQRTIPEEGVFIPGDYLTDGWLNGVFWEHATPMEREIFRRAWNEATGRKGQLGQYLQRPPH